MYLLSYGSFQKIRIYPKTTLLVYGPNFAYIPSHLSDSASGRDSNRTSQPNPPSWDSSYPTRSNRTEIGFRSGCVQMGGWLLLFIFPHHCSKHKRQRDHMPLCLGQSQWFVSDTNLAHCPRETRESFLGLTSPRVQTVTFRNNHTFFHESFRIRRNFS